MSPENSNKRAAIIWCTNGGDHEYWKYSVASFRMQVKSKADFYAVAFPTDSLHNVDRIYNLRRIDPTPYLRELGFTKEGYDRLGKRWPMAILYKLCVPLIGELKGYDSVMTLDTDVMAMPTSKLHTVDDVLNHPLGEFELAGVPDLYEPLDRTATLVRENTPDSIRGELEERVWSKFGYGCQSYISAGLFLWNIPVIDRDIDWYIRRCKAFWGNIGAYRFPEQDFVNQFMAVDSRLQSTFGARADGNGPYVVADACMRHFTGVGKSLMFNMGKKIPEITPTARFDQACVRPRDSDIVASSKSAVLSRCIVFTCGNDAASIKKLNYALNSLEDVCKDKLSGIDLFVLCDGRFVVDRIKRQNVRVLDVSELMDRSGFRAICNWRSGRISWDRSKVLRLFIPFVPQLQKYDLSLFIEGNMVITSPKMIDVFDEDVTGYDYAMSAEFRVAGGLYLEHKDVRFCKAFTQALYDVKDSNDILCRLNAGCYFSTSVMLVNMREARKTYSTFARLCKYGVSCVGNGAPAVEHNMLNSTARVKRISGAYNTAGTTHFIGDPVYCVHAYTDAKDGERYPSVSTKQFL